MTRTRLLPAAVLLAASLALTGCGDSGESGTSGSPNAPTTRSGQPHNDADTAFAQQMLAHHTQAIEMTDLAGVSSTDKKVRAIAAGISKAQTAEIGQISGWLDDWDQHHESADHGHGPGEAPDGTVGMMSADAMTELAATRGKEFDRMWLTMMIEHHEGAITMARDQTSQGQFKPAKVMAAKIVVDQTKELAVLRAALKAGR